MSTRLTVALHAVYRNHGEINHSPRAHASSSKAIALYRGNEGEGVDVEFELSGRLRKPMAVEL
jgi:hypothetical protein